MIWVFMITALVAAYLMGRWHGHEEGTGEVRRLRNELFRRNQEVVRLKRLVAQQHEVLRKIPLKGRDGGS